MQGFAASGTVGGAPQGGGAKGGGSGGGLVDGVVSQYRQQIAAQRYAARASWVRARRVLNRLLNTNEFLSVRPLPRQIDGRAHAAAPPLLMRPVIFRFCSM